MTNKERAEVLEQVVEYIQANQQVLTLREETDSEPHSVVL